MKTFDIADSLVKTGRLLTQHGLSRQNMKIFYTAWTLTSEHEAF